MPWVFILHSPEYFFLEASPKEIRYAKKRMAKSSIVVKCYTESNEQIAAMDWLRAQHPFIAEHTLHIGNERKASYYAGYIMKRMGVLKGASDIFMAWPNAGFHGLFIEVKSKIGRPSAEQKAFIQRMRDRGYKAEICYGADEVINTMREYINYQGISSSSKPAS